MSASPFPFDPKLDLVLDRVVPVPREKVWKAWTTPAQLMKWFTPVPWKTVACEIDLWPGGKFHTVMQSPEGQTFPGTGCYLEVVPNERLTWTSALLPGYRPQPTSAMDMPFTATLSLTSEGSGTRYRVLAVHRDEAGCQAHASMGFETGWGKALDQMVAMIQAE